MSETALADTVDTSLRTFFKRDVINDTVATTNPLATSTWLIKNLGARKIEGQDANAWLALFSEGKGTGEQPAHIVKIKGHRVEDFPSWRFCHLDLQLKGEFSLDEVAEKLVAQGFVIVETGATDKEGYGWRILHAPERDGLFAVHLARRRPFLLE